MIEGAVPWPDDFVREYVAAGYWRGVTFGAELGRWAREYGDRVAVVGSQSRLTFAEIDREADRVAYGLHHLGIRGGNRVVVHLPNRPEFVPLLFGLFRLGAVPVLALPAHRRTEIEYLVETSGAVAYFISDRFLGFDYRQIARALVGAGNTLRWTVVCGDPEEFLAFEALDGPPVELVGPDASDVALFLLSGGTTGLPKLIPRTHNDYLYNALACADALAVDGGGVYLAANSVAHNAALGCPGLLGTMAKGGKTVLAPTPSPDDAFGLIRDEGVTLTTLVPTVVQLWAEAHEFLPIDLSGLVLQVGSAMFTPELARSARGALGCRLTRWYGIGEGLLTYTRLDDPDEVVVATDGRPLSPADEIRVVDEGGDDAGCDRPGELLARGPYTIRGYYNAAAKNAESFTGDGFFRTGDLVRRRRDGNLVVVGRVREMINKGGEKVSPEELEALLSGCPGIGQVAVGGTADALLGQRICAFVVAAGAPPDLDGVRGWLRRRGVADYKLPDRLVVVDHFPRTPVGKVAKSQLLASLATG